MPSRVAEPSNPKTAEREEYRPPFGAPYVWILAVIDGPQPNAMHRIVQYETVIGRGEGVQIDLDDEQVSKRHCQIRVEGPVCTIQELGSLNGTFVNGRKMRDDTALRLRHLDEIQIGSTRLFLLHGAYKRITTQ
jgi:pSer/pThr/pTyr-binding forkhead associated (FHA) protein